MEFDTGMFLEPALVLLVRSEIAQNDVKLAARKGGHDFVHEAEKLDTPAPLGMLPENFPGSDFKSGEVMGKPMSSWDGSSAVDAPAPLSMSVPAAAIANVFMIILCVRAAFDNLHIGAIDIARLIRGKEGHGVGDPNAICPRAVPLLD